MHNTGVTGHRFVYTYVLPLDGIHTRQYVTASCYKVPSIVALNLCCFHLSSMANHSPCIECITETAGSMILALSVRTNRPARRSSLYTPLYTLSKICTWQAVFLLFSALVVWTWTQPPVFAI
ncbi:hypothetical protein BU24DRAFT_229506 [Aaosphaeria arxii CBS 175.79]|uniref:Uncharacterized protein n=1 Tax=Aaosphaeria arxii CBS 175.79 TaxID=1450172 RepID=A0A6A5XJM6_9PLEO|nr:uncharacterized protein BU24DRAFT_229506 [Aaosphaeria arxii CBS 175.79]KAF2013086.1 hypothetical protein BU24DRAFT_229506 [Aaosphaeria arxii CBS 175.79]